MQRKMIDYIVVCVNEFAAAKNMTEREAYRYLFAHKGIEFLIDHYEIEHTLSLADAISDLSMICIKNGGAV